MIDWGYWRWQLIRNMPIIGAVLVICGAAGWMITSSMATRYSASSVVVLERSISLSDAPKKLQTAQNIQHLKVVIHALNSKGMSPPDTFALSIKSARDKPTYLHIKTTASSPKNATHLATKLAQDAIVTSVNLHKLRIETSLSKLTSILNMRQKQSLRSQQALLDHNSDAGPDKFLELQVIASQIKSQITASSTTSHIDSPALVRLYSDLTTAKGIYSDRHPKVRLIRSRISRELSLTTPHELDEKSQDLLQSRLKDVVDQLERAQTSTLAKEALERDVATTNTAQQHAQNALNAAQIRSEASITRFKMVQSATLENNGFLRKKTALYIALMLAAFAFAMAVVTLRIKVDQRIRRPADLKRALGLTPFATLPDFGPSLA